MMGTATMQGPTTSLQSRLGLLLFGDRDIPYSWSKVNPDKRGLLNLLQLITNEGLLNWGKTNQLIARAVKFLLQYLPDRELEEKLIHPRILAALSMNDAQDLFKAENLEGGNQITVRGFATKLWLELRHVFRDNEQMLGILDKTRNISLIGSFEPNDPAISRTITNIRGAVDARIWSVRILRHINSDEAFLACVKAKNSKAFDEALWHYEGIHRFPELYVKCLKEIAEKPDMAGEFPPRQIVPAEILKLVPTRELLALYSSSATARFLEPLPNLKHLTFGWILKQRGDKRVYEQADLKARSINHAPMSEYRSALPIVEKVYGANAKALLVQLYLVNHLFKPSGEDESHNTLTNRFFRDGLTYGRLPQSLKVNPDLWKAMETI